MTLERIGLPGVGVSHLLTTRDGVRLATPRSADAVAVIRGVRVLPHPDSAIRLPGAVLVTVGGQEAPGRRHQLPVAPC